MISFNGSIPTNIGEKRFIQLLEKIESKTSIDNKNCVSSAYFLIQNKKRKVYCLKSDTTSEKKKVMIDIFEKVRFNTDLAMRNHLFVNGYGLSSFDKAINSYSNRTVLWDEGEIGLNQIKVYSLQLPEIFFNENGKKKITVTLTFTPETRSSRGDSYLGNRMTFHLFHSINPQVLIENYGVISKYMDQSGLPEDLKKFEIEFYPGGNTRKAGCHQKAWKIYKQEPKNRPSSPISLVLLNFNKWINNIDKIQKYCISVTFEHEKEIDLYNQIRANVQVRTRIKS